MNFIDKVKELDSKRTQGDWFAENGEVYQQQGLACISTTYPGIKKFEGNGPFIALAPKMAKVLIAIDQELDRIEDSGNWQMAACIEKIRNVIE